jgi:REP element-mobilizing transposase RayT
MAEHEQQERVTRRTARAPRARQLTIFRRGGKRPGAGRKPRGVRKMVSHHARPALAPRFPVLVTTRVRAGLPSLRRKEALEVATAAFAACIERADRHGMRLVHFTVQSNHLHLIVEARSAQSLARGMQGLLVRIARGLNRLWHRTGPLFAGRYHARILRSPREVRNALVYVLNNARKHGCHVAGADPCASGSSFDGWKGNPSVRRTFERGVGRAPPTLAPRTWLLARGWRRRGLILVSEVPGSGAQTVSSRGGRAMLRPGDAA